MENLNVVEILKMGLPGLVLLLSVLSYRLLSNEQSKQKPSDVVLRSIKQFMYLNFIFAGLTVAAPLVERFQPASHTLVVPFDAVAMVGELPIGSADVCSSSGNANRYLVVGNTGKPEHIQVFARGVMPCSDDKQITISALEAKKTLKWPKDIDQKDVRVSVAPLGFMFNQSPIM